MIKYFLAIDIGASSGRHIVGYKDDKGEIQTDEVYRFSNSVMEKDGHLIWDIDYLESNVKFGIKKALNKYPHIESLSIDTWGVDYVLLDENDKPIKPIYAYRDERTEESIDKVHQIIPFEELYKLTGSQFQKFNTIYQLYEDKLTGRLEKAKDLLMIPEYLLFCLTGVKKREYTNASTTGMLGLNSDSYAPQIIKALGFDEKMFNKLYKPGTVLGNLKEDVQKEVGGNIKAVLCATHDTASAVEGIQMKDKDAVYISSGTWSLLGIRLDKGIANKESLKANYSNETGPNYIRFQKNIISLWIIQGLQKQMDLPFTKMVDLARTSHYEEIYDVNDESLLSSTDMLQSVKDLLIKEGKKEPSSSADYINSTYRSLAYSYKVALDELKKITKREFSSLYIVGGGAKNQYLNDLTQSMVGIKVIPLPIEATAIGNLIVQMEVNHESRD